MKHQISNLGKSAQVIARTAALALVGMSYVALGATSGTLNLSGSVAALFSLTVIENSPTNTNLNLTGGEFNTLVGQVSENSNNGSGYKIDVASASGGALVNGANVVNYQISYDGSAFFTPSASPVNVKNSSFVGTHLSDVRISLTGNAGAASGNYSDTLTFTISAP